MYTVLLVIHTIVVLFLIMMVLIQRTESDGMAGLGGGGGNQFMTGRSAANFMTRTTAILAAVFMTSSLVLAVIVSRTTAHSIVDAVPAIEEPAAPVKQDPASKQEKKAETPKKAPVVPKPE
jgi:preprotein translocase subunit SecG